jgi:vitamin B12 transporter
MIHCISSTDAGLPAGARACARLALLPLALAAAFPALAQPAAAEPALRETVVTAARVEQPLSDLVADVSIIDRATIERSGATGVADVLARLPGIEIARSGGLGNTSSVFVRGAESRFTAVYIDGVRVESQSTGGPNWESIPLAQIDRIEVLRGPAAAVYGSDAIGGVIQLFTRKGEAGVSPYVGVGIGSRNLRRIEAGVSGAAGGFDYSLGVAREKSDGFNVRLDPGYDPDRDGYRNTSGNARLGFQINAQHRLEATLLASDLKSGYDDFGYVPGAPVDDRSRYKLRTAGLSWTAQWTDVWRTRLSLSDSIGKYETVPNFYRTETDLRGFLFQNEFRFGPHLVTAALERREDKLKNAPGVGDFASPGLDRDRSQDAIALGYGFTQGPHALQINLRHDDDSEFGGQNTGSIAYGFSVTPAWRVTASAGTAFRAPTLYQRFSEYGVAGLDPEKGRNVELGLRYAEGATSASATVYRNRVRNLIGFDYSSTACQSFFGCYGNTARATYEGVTLAASQRFGDVTLRGSLDFQDPRDDISDKLLVQRARRHGTLGADLRLGTWTLGAEVQASGMRYADAANSQRLHGYAVFNLSATAPITPELSVVARIDNVADRDYQLVRNYATPGRAAYLGLKWAPKL